MSEDAGNGRRIVFTEQFSEQLEEVTSRSTYGKIKRRILTLGQFPGIGSPNPRLSLAERFGPDIRVSPVDRFVIVYRASDDAVELLALTFGPNVT